MQKPRQCAAVFATRKEENEKEGNSEVFDYIVSGICEEKKGLNIKFL